MNGKHYQYIGQIKGDFTEMDRLIKSYEKISSKIILLKRDEKTLDDEGKITTEINEHNTVFFQIFDHEYPEIFKKFINITGLDKAVASFITQTPGNTLPLHQDLFINFKIKYNLDPKSQNVVRYMIFMEDWQPGHTFLVEDETIINWKKGDMIYWGDKYHLGSNAGKVPKTTLNITGIINKNSAHIKENPNLNLN